MSSIAHSAFKTKLSKPIVHAFKVRQDRLDTHLEIAASREEASQDWLDAMTDEYENHLLAQFEARDDQFSNQCAIDHQIANLVPVIR